MTRRRRHEERDPRIIGAIAFVVVLVAVVLTLQHDLPFVGEGGEHVIVEVSAARQVTTKTPVRVRGIEVGQVRAVRLRPERGLTELEVRLTDESVLLRRDARAALRWRTVLGGRMELALDPGSPSAPPLSGGRIPLSRTRVQTELEDVTGAFDADGRSGARALLQELPEALDGDAAGRAVDALDQRLKPLGAAMRSLRGQDDRDVSRLVANAARATASLDRTRGALGALVDGAAATLRVTAERRSELAATFRQAPPALVATRSTAAEIDRTLPNLDRLVAELRPPARRLGPVLRRVRPVAIQLQTLLRDARPVVALLRPAVARLGDASVVGRRLLAGLDPTLRRTQNELLPYLERTDDDIGLPVNQLIGPTFSALAAAGGLFHDTGHIVNFPVQPSESSQTLLPCTLFLTDPSAAQKVRCTTLDRGLRALLTGARDRGGR